MAKKHSYGAGRVTEGKRRDEEEGEEGELEEEENGEWRTKTS